MAELTPADALELLKAGNARFVAGTPRCEAFGARVAGLANGQSPFARRAWMLRFARADRDRLRSAARETYSSCASPEIS